MEIGWNAGFIKRFWEKRAKKATREPVPGGFTMEAVCAAIDPDCTANVQKTPGTSEFLPVFVHLPVFLAETMKKAGIG